MKKIKSIIISILLFLVSHQSLYAANIAPAQTVCENGIDTAIGCLPLVSLNSWASIFLKIGIGLGGGIATFMIIYAGFMIITSTGDPARLKAGQELLTSAVAGVIMLIFSMFILRIVGGSILGII